MKFNIANKEYDLVKQSGTLVTKNKGGYFYICESSNMAKTLTEWSHGINLNEFLREHLPLKVVNVFAFNPRTHSRNNSPQSRVLLNQCVMAHHESIYFNYAEKYGFDKVVSNHHLFMLEDFGFERKKEFIQNQINRIDYKKILGGSNE